MSQIVAPLQKNSIANGRQLMMSLINGEFIPGKPWKKSLFRLKFLCRSLFCWRITTGLADTLASNFLMEQILQAQPNLPCKLHRPYLTAKMSKLEGLFALRDHYALIAQRMPLNLLVACLNEDPVVVAKALDKQGNEVMLKISSIDHLNKEGEVTLSACDANGVVLAKITFTLMNYCQQPTIFIGGLQGADKHVPHAEIHQATKACYGLFPKRLALEGICSLGHYLGINQIIAVDNAGHIYQNWRYHHKKKDELHADYDQFWLSIGGRQMTCGYFQLPLRIARKPIESIASKKRAEYRRRYQLLDELDCAMSECFSGEERQSSHSPDDAGDWP
ncbi:MULTISPECIES: VirK/YbjX family protein [unclassified Brenneria]|uniref:VirK/YbjX family protein n=2 Tax=unclassified Brenneria TaxID=2634434 RepID=UPI0039B5BE25